MRGKNVSAEDLTAKKELTLEVIRRLKAEYPDAGCTLDYDHAWQLLVSVRLAAQCTDARVNIVVQDLFAKYPSVAALAEAEPEDIEASSTTSSVRKWRMPGWSFPAPALTAVWWRPWSCPAVTSIWVHSSTPSSRAAPTALIPCSRALSPPHSNSASMHSAA